MDQDPYATEPQPAPPEGNRDAHPPVDEPRGRPPALGWKQRLAGGAGFAILVLLALMPTALRAVGHWLVVEDAIVPADAIYVHAGHTPFRSMEAAEIYGQGLAAEVWLAPVATTPASEALRDLGIERPPPEYWRSRVLLRLDVPQGAIRVLPTEVLNTADEVTAVVEELAARGLDSAILVTSKQHSRRVRMLWRRIAPAGKTAIVRPSAVDPFDPDAWWTNTDDAQAVLHELAAIAALWLGIDLRPAKN